MEHWSHGGALNTRHPMLMAPDSASRELTGSNSGFQLSTGKQEGPNVKKRCSRRWDPRCTRNPVPPGGLPRTAPYCYCGNTWVWPWIWWIL